MQTKYAFGRDKLPSPIVIVENGGAISGNNDTYYFWVKARNRVGYNTVSDAAAITIGNAKRIRISAASFATLPQEGWIHIIVSVSKTNDYSTSRVIYKQELYDSTQVTKITPQDVVFLTNFSINGNAEINDIDNLPTDNLIHGFRILLTTTQRIYEYRLDSNLPADNITILPSINGQWVSVSSNSFRELDNNCTKELFQVNDTELIEAPLPSIFQSSVPILYYLINDELVPLAEGELDLNAFISDTSLQLSFFVKVLGYLNLTNMNLDTTGIDYVNTVVVYPDTKIRLSKPLPSGSALVLEILPNILLTSTITEGTYITLYPKLNRYTVIEGIPDYGEAVADISLLKALPESTYKDKQVRYVESKRTLYAFDTESSLVDNGDTVLTPVGNPSTGRWIANNVNILPGTITPEMFSSESMSLVSGGISTDSVVVPLSTTYTIDLTNLNTDYLILQTPEEDGATTTINITATLPNNSTKAIVLELRQKTGTVQFHESINFPGGNVPILSGNNKIDLFVLKVTKDNTGITKKRAFMVQKDIG